MQPGSFRFAVTAAALWLAAAVSAFGDDWPGWLGLRGDGTSAERGWRKDWPEEGPRQLFDLAVGEGYSAVAVARGHALLFHRLGRELLVESLHPTTGDRQWRYAYPTDYRDRYGYNGGPRCAPIVEVGEESSRVFTLGPKGVLHALELSTGKKLWVRDLKEEFDVDDNFFGVGAVPDVDEGHLFLHLGGTETGTGAAFAIEAATGRVIWKSPIDGGSYAGARVARIGETRHVFIFHRGGLSCLDPSSGRERWKFPWRSRTYESVNASTPLVVGDTVFASAAYRTGSFALRVGSGDPRVLWKDDPLSRDKAMETHWSTAIPVDGHLYGFSGRHESEAALHCVRLETGERLWRWPSYLGRGSLLYSDGHFIALGERGDLALLRLSPEKHDVLRRVPGLLRYPAWTPPVLANGILYLRDERRLIALDLRDGPPAGG